MATVFKDFHTMYQAYGCPVEIYNHNGWRGNEDNELAVLGRLKEMGITDIGLVYNFSHTHDADHDDMTYARASSSGPFARSRAGPNLVPKPGIGPIVTGRIAGAASASMKSRGIAYFRHRFTQAELHRRQPRR